MAYFSNISSLPEDCVSRILSLTSPKDACRVLVVSREFRNPSESNLVWESFLPNDDCFSLTISANIPTYILKFSSKKQLFLMLSNYILIDGGNKAFSLQKSTGRKSYILSAKHLKIFNAEIDNVWSWKSIPESRFSEVAELKTVTRLEIEGRIRSEKLSPNTKYGVYLLIKICDWAFGLDSIPCEISILSSVKGEILSNTAYLRDGADADSSKKKQLEGLFYGNRVHMLKKRIDIKRDERLGYKRKDGWLEIEFGEFFNVQESNEEIIMNLVEVKGNQLKGGLIVEGIEIRPTV